MKRLLWILVVAVAAVGLYARHLLKSHPGTLEYGLGFEIARFLIQLVLLVLFGGAFMQEYNKRRDKGIARNEFRKGVLRRLMQVYSNAKRVRLLIRAKSRGKVSREAEERTLAWEPYEQQMSCIGDGKIEIEMLRRELHLFPDVFSKDRMDSLKECLDGMEDYLRMIIREYRDDAREVRDDHGHVRLSRLPATSRFARATDEGGDFRPSFSDRFYAAARVIQEERLKL